MIAYSKQHILYYNTCVIELVVLQDDCKGLRGNCLRGDLSFLLHCDWSVAAADQAVSELQG